MKNMHVNVSISSGEGIAPIKGLTRLDFIVNGQTPIRCTEVDDEGNYFLIFEDEDVK